MKLSIIVPVFNSADNLLELHRRIYASIIKMNLENNFEIILINDFSEDESWKIIKS
mgnify:FL=1